MPLPSPSIHIDPARVIDEVDPRIYSGFTEHMGRCIYGFRKDVMEVLKELKMPLVRYPGGNFVSSYRWQDGIGPRELRPRRPELAWLTEESNHFGTDEFIQWCREMDVEPFICLNMGTGTLEDALAWLEYCNSSANTYFANLRRKNGHEAPYNVKVWGPWQVGQMESQDYAKKAFQWAKALRLLDPSIKLISCGETGCTDWDRVTLKKLAPVVDFHSIHRNSSAAAEKAIEISRSLIDLAKIENNLSKELTVCFDEWNVWDPIRAPGEKGAEEHYDLSDALAVAAWLNVFVGQCHFANHHLPEGLFRQTTYYPLHLFSNLMRGSSLNVHVSTPSQDLVYTGPTKPEFVKDLTLHTPSSAKLTKYVDVSAVAASTPQGGQEIRVALLNRHASEGFTVPILFGPAVSLNETVKVYEIWHEDIKRPTDSMERR
ncbi:glycoside hydrolase family 51 protein [Coprinopsis sp. MPI-PUGE-AT-0042]|nr:glycoside hydrolase family 51 protein [Coprinopsis sp. MPI-PUGE-AT-0042]